jgi:hypothetical protein
MPPVLQKLKACRILIETFLVVCNEELFRKFNNLSISDLNRIILEKVRSRNLFQLGGDSLP